MFSFKRNLTIEWAQCDPAGIVYYPNYFSMFSESTIVLLDAALGFNKREMMKRFGTIGIPMLDTGAVFHVASRFGDIVTIESEISRLGRSSFDIQHRMTKGEVLAIECYEKRVWAIQDPSDPNRIKSQPIPVEVVERLKKSH